MKKLSLYVFLVLSSFMLSGCGDTTVGDFFNKITIKDIIAVIFFVWFLFWLDRKEREDQTGKITKIIDFVGAVYLIGYGLYIASLINLKDLFAW